MPESISTALTASIIGGLVVVCLQSLFIFINGWRERKLRKEMALEDWARSEARRKEEQEAQRKFQAEEAERAWERAEKTRKEIRFFDMKIKAYEEFLPFLKDDLFEHGFPEDLFRKGEKLMLFMPPECRSSYLRLIQSRNAGLDEINKALGNFRADLGIDIALHHGDTRTPIMPSE